MKLLNDVLFKMIYWYLLGQLDWQVSTFEVIVGGEGFEIHMRFFWNQQIPISEPYQIVQVSLLADV